MEVFSPGFESVICCSLVVERIRCRGHGEAGSFESGRLKPEVESVGVIYIRMYEATW